MQPSKHEKEWLSPLELEEEIGIKPSSQAKLRAAGKLPYSKVGKVIRYSRTRINKLFEDAEVVISKEITQEQLKALYTYETTTGLFTHIKTGKCASSLHNGYVRITINYKDYYAHRLVFLYMNGEFPKGTVDHKNHNKSDNRWSNLRIVSHQENGKNTSLYATNNSGTSGVYWHKRDKKWIACIYVNGIKKHLGCFDDKDDAIAAREDANLTFGFHENHGKDVA